MQRTTASCCPGAAGGGSIFLWRVPNRAAIFCGDVIHRPVQVHEPTWNTRCDEDPGPACATRLKVLWHRADSGALHFPTHFAAPRVASIAARGSGFVPRFVPPPRSDA